LSASTKSAATALVWFFSKYEGLNRVWQAIDFGSLTIYPKMIGDLLIGSVHYDDGHLSIRVDECR